MKKIIIGLVIVLAFGLFLYKSESQKFGGSNTAYPSSGATQGAVLASTTASTALLTANSARSYAAICNIDATAPVYLGLGASAAKNSGVRIAPSTCYEIGQDNLFIGAVNVISASSTNSTTTFVTIP